MSAAYVSKATHGYVSFRLCGCVNFISMDSPDLSKSERRETAERIAELVADKCRVEWLTDTECREAAKRFGYCDACRPAREPQQAPLFGAQP